MAEFLIVLRPARTTFLDDATEGEKALVAAHFEHLQALQRAGALVLAGRTEGAEMGLVVFEAPDARAARRVLDDDPAVQAGVFTGELYPYRIALERLARA